MKKILAQVLFTILLGVKLSLAQNPSSFYIDTIMQWSNPLFSNDKIYFRSFDGHLLATDYNGNIQWSKRIATPVSFMTADVNYLYATSGNKVFKVDSTGNVVWVKDFSNKINPASTDDNVIGDFLFDGTRIYLSIIQAPFVQQAGPHVYPSIVTLDTSGTILNVISEHIQPSTSFGLQPGIASLTGGAWIGYVYAPGFTHYSYLKRVTSAGDYDLTANSPSFFFATTTDIEACIYLTDSTYLVATNSNWMGGGHFELSKINEHGDVVWQKVYSDTLFTCGTAGTQINNITSDSLGNIYAMGTAGENPCTGTGYFGPFCMKLDSIGNVLFTKLWTHSSLTLNNGYKSFQYRNGKLFCSVLYQGGKPGVLIMDTLFQGSCNDADSVISLQGSLRVGVTSPVIPSGTTLPYVPLVDTITNFSSALSRSDLCLSLNYPLDITKNRFIFFPNPTSGKLKIQTDKLIEAIQVFNLFGEKVLEATATNEIDLTDQLPGIYFIRGQSEGKIHSFKIVLR